MQKYQQLSHHFQYESDIVGNIIEKDLSIINVPKIFYGDRIKRGSVRLDMYLSGTLIGTLQDSNQNGELRQTGPAGSTGSGSVAGLAFYDEGLLVLTGSWNLTRYDCCRVFIIPVERFHVWLKRWKYKIILS